MFDQKILHKIKEVKRLPRGERGEFLRLLQTPPHEMTKGKEKRWEYFTQKVNLERLRNEYKWKEARIPAKMDFVVLKRNPYVLKPVFRINAEEGLTLPERLVPGELRNPPKNKKLDLNYITAIASADLDKKELTSFKFEGYPFEKHSKKELLDKLESRIG